MHCLVHLIIQTDFQLIPLPIAHWHSSLLATFGVLAGGKSILPALIPTLSPVELRTSPPKPGTSAPDDPGTFPDPTKASDIPEQVGLIGCSRQWAGGQPLNEV